jgi:hypothetical protein
MNSIGIHQVGSDDGVRCPTNTYSAGGHTPIDEFRQMLLGMTWAVDVVNHGPGPTQITVGNAQGVRVDVDGRSFLLREGQSRVVHFWIVKSGTEFLDQNPTAIAASVSARSQLTGVGDHFTWKAEARVPVHDGFVDGRHDHLALRASLTVDQYRTFPPDPDQLD